MNEELKVIISAEIDRLIKELDKGKKEVEDFGEEGEKSSIKFQDAMQKAGEVSGKVLTAMSAAIAAAGAALIGLAVSTEEYRTNQAKLNTAFEVAGASAETAKQTYNDLYRVLGEDDVATEAAGHLAKLTTNQKDLSEWTQICQGVYATFGDSLPIESLTEAANETAKNGILTGGLSDALVWAGQNEEEFQKKLDACNTEAEREALIRSTLSGLYDDAAKAYEENAASILAQHEAEAKLNESTARIGEAMQPILTMLYELGATILEYIAPHIESFVNEHGEQLKAILIKLAEFIGNIIGFIVDNWGTISTIATVVIAISAAISLVNTVLSIYTAVQALANTQMLTAMAVILALIAIVALVVMFWDEISAACSSAAEAVGNAWDGMVEWFGGIVEGIKNWFVGIGEWFGNLFSGAAEAVTTAWGNIGNFFGNIWGGIKQTFSNVGSWFGNVFTSAKNAVTSAWGNIGNWFSNIKNSITQTFSNVGNWFGNVFSNAVNKIKSVFSNVVNFFKNVFTQIQNIFVDIGSKISESITGAVKGAVNWVLRKATDVINGAIAAINGAIEFINLIPGVNIGKIQEMQAPQLARGGIVESATLAVVGEAGKEAVIPLENNLGWLDKLATMLNERMGGSSPVVLEVDGMVLAKSSVNNINKLTRQTGNLPLVLA